MDYFFIINPGSRHRGGARFIPALLKTLQIRRIDFDFRITETLQDACRFSREANLKGAAVVVAVGGDGTINQVINGFYDDDGKRISSSKLGVIHTGTSPDFCRSYGIPTQPELALEALLRGFTQEVSVARIEYHDQSGSSRRGYFACCASFGLGAQVARAANSGLRNILGDTLGTFASILLALGRYKASDLVLHCDGNPVVIERNFNTFIGKTAWIASGMKVAHELACDDKRLYILAVKKINIHNLVPALRAIYSGKAIRKHDYITFCYAQTIEIQQGSINNEIEFDGDPQGYLPCRISVAADPLEVITHEL